MRSALVQNSNSLLLGVGGSPQCGWMEPLTIDPLLSLVFITAVIML